jgi:hypothetical protein
MEREFWNLKPSFRYGFGVKEYDINNEKCMALIKKQNDCTNKIREKNW